MSNVVTMAGNPLQTVRTLLEVLIERYDAGDISHIVVVAERSDGCSEIIYDRQAQHQVVYASAVLQTEALRMAAESVVE